MLTLPGDIKSQLSLKEDKKIMCSGDVSDHGLEDSSPGAESRWGCVCFYRYRKKGGCPGHPIREIKRAV